MDETIILGYAIEYMKHLRERVKILEDQSRKKSMESFVWLEDDRDDHRLFEIEAKVCDKNILLKIQCEKRKGVVVKIIGEVENKLNLDVASISVAPFGSLSIEITIVAQMEKESCKVLLKDVVTTIRSALVDIGQKY
ncbi:hypothetical protein ACJIZ3_008309 [Penstemon smallii]|uniref:Plant bHLH transcription factor ACT-like domain-containing protein n=1 Tax=Penstemon smallii TaxID=265156 RepID=A0ABD3TAF6_9LAMI